MTRKKATMSWSGGKDSALALYRIQQEGEYDVVNLHTLIGTDTKRVGLHGIREELIDAQAEALGITLTKLYLDTASHHDIYRSLVNNYYKLCAGIGLEVVVFGDIFLEDLRRFREDILKDTGMSSVYPLWKEDTRLLVNEFIDLNFRTVVCSANQAYFEPEQLGMIITSDWIDALRPEVDPCGENGEFHTFVVDGPLFKHPITYQCGEQISQTYRYSKVNEEGVQEEVITNFLFQDVLLK